MLAFAPAALNPDETPRVDVEFGRDGHHKLDAARRQLDVAARLYFAEVDPLAVHTLVGAAHILITDLSKAGKVESIVDRFVVTKYRGEFEKALRSVQNFLKHSDKDPDATLDYDPHATELMLFIDIEMFKELIDSVTDPMRTFHIYASTTPWGRAAFERFPQDAVDTMTATTAHMSKREFFEHVMKLIADGRATGTVE